MSWTQFLRSQAAVACDFATPDTALLRRYCLLFFIDITNREDFVAGITTNPTGARATQAAPNLFLRHNERPADARALVGDRGSHNTISGPHRGGCGICPNRRRGVGCAQWGSG